MGQGKGRQRKEGRERRWEHRKKGWGGERKGTNLQTPPAEEPTERRRYMRPERAEK